jgi:hypothetical protein
MGVRFRVRRYEGVWLLKEFGSFVAIDAKELHGREKISLWSCTIKMGSTPTIDWKTWSNFAQTATELLIVCQRKKRLLGTGALYAESQNRKIDAAEAAPKNNVTEKSHPSQKKSFNVWFGKYPPHRFPSATESVTWRWQSGARSTESKSPLGATGRKN